MHAPSPLIIGLLVLLPLVAWRMYARFRRLVGRQRASRVRPWITLTLLPALSALLAYEARGDAAALASLAVALAAGAALGRYGLRRTRFEASPGGLFYTPHAPLGIALSVLLAGRIVYRLVELAARGAQGATHAGFVRSPLTLVIFGMVAGYYVAYAVGLVRWRRAVLNEASRRRSAGEGNAG
jgi:hypothetical protein